MKKITTLLLIVIMLVTSMTSVFAVNYNPADIVAPLKLGQFVDVLIGEGLADTSINDPKAQDGTLGLQTVYKNISPDQIAKFKAFNTALNSYNDADLYSEFVGIGGLTLADIKVLVKGIAQIMTFIPDETLAANQPFSGQYKADHLLGDATSDLKNDKVLSGIDRVAEYFYGASWKDATSNPNAAPAANSAADVLNKISDGKLTKNALGGLVYELKKELRVVLKDENVADNLISTFKTKDSDIFITNIKPLMAKAIANVFKNANPVTQLHLLKKGLETKGMLNITGSYPNETVDVNSKFIQIVEKAFDLMSLVPVDGNTNYDIAATVANINLAGVLDVKLLNTSNSAIISPNQSIDFNNSTASVTFKVVPNPNASSVENFDLIKNQNINLTNWCNYAVHKGALTSQQDATAEFNIISSNDTITISPNTQTLNGGKYVLKLYRRVAVETANDYTLPSTLRANDPITSDKLIKDLFIEIPMSYTKTETGGNPPGSGGGGTTVKKYTVTTTVSGSSTTTENKGGKTIVTNSNGETGTFTEGTTVKIVATAEPGYKFVGWNQGGVIISTSPEYTFVLGKDIDFVAQFVKDDGLERLSHNWYLRGYPDGSFNADRMLTRAEMAMVLYRISSDEKRQETVPENAFSDVDASEWYTKAITFLKNKNIINGYENGEFRPNAPVTRAEMATMVSRYDSLKSDSNNPFSDVTNDNWAYDYIISASLNNWIVGYPDSTFKPNGLATRAETATLVNRVLDRKIELADISKTDTLQYTDLSDTHWGYTAIMEATHTHKFTRKQNGFELWSDIVKPVAGFND